jgi:A/G-specific adenine glycosylase
MLQQTHVPRVVPKYEAFLDRFPTAAACAAAPTSSVIDSWHGLGYNRRAVLLQRAAHAVVDRHGGTIPDDLDELLALPGVGAYTARAVLVFAFERDLGLVDTNAGRFVARGLAGRPIASPREAQAIADSAVPAGHGWTWGQAVFDLGAAICRKREPSCDVCPVRQWCAWAAGGWPTPDPVHAGSAGISGRQSRFAGSDRQGRGRLVAAMRLGPVATTDLATVMGWADDPKRARRVAATLVADGLAVTTGGRWRLP